MMETPVPYGSAAPIRPECLRAYADGWQLPTSNEIRAVLKIAGLTGSQAGQLVGVADTRTIRRWTGGESPIPFAAWAILCELAGYGRIWARPPIQDAALPEAEPHSEGARYEGKRYEGDRFEGERFDGPRR